MKTAEDSQKFIQEKQKYDKVVELKDKIINEANQPKTGKRSKKPTAAAATPSKDATGGTKEALTQSMKKLKIDSKKSSLGATPINLEEKKAELTEAPEEPEKKDKEIVSTKDLPPKESKSKIETPAKPKNNTLLTQFFSQKKTEQKVKDVEKPTEIKEKLKFRCIGSKLNKSDWSSERAERFSREFQDTTAHSVESLRQQLISRHAPSRSNLKQMVISTKKTRKIFVSLQDSFRKIKGKFDSSSGYVTARAPLTKDPQIDYDMDSEEEHENQFAENLDEVEDAEEEDDEEFDEEESVFIVSDGHLSSYEAEQVNECNV